MESTRIPWNQMNELKPHKGEHTWVIYTTGGEHLLIEADLLSQYENKLEFYLYEKDDHSKETGQIATFYCKSLVGWELIK